MSDMVAHCTVLLIPIGDCRSIWKRVSTFGSTEMEALSHCVHVLASPVANISFYMSDPGRYWSGKVKGEFQVLTMSKQTIYAT